MKKILVTGGAGFIGYHLVKTFLNSEHKYSIDIVDNFSRGKKDIHLNELFAHKNINFLKKNINKKIFFKKNYDLVFHLAATVGVKNVNKNSYYTLKNNIQPLIYLLDGFSKFKKKPKIIFFSTSEVYVVNQRKFKKYSFSSREDIILPSVTIPRESYFISKIICENLLKFSDFNFTILRPHNIYGPRMGFSHVIPELIKKNHSNKKYKVFSPFHSRCFCYIDDAIKQIIKLSLSNKTNRKVYNIGNDKEEIKIFDLAKKIQEIQKSDTKFIKGKNTLGSPVKRKPHLADNIKVTKFKKFTSLNVGLKKTMKWYLSEKKN